MLWPAIEAYAVSFNYLVTLSSCVLVESCIDGHHKQATELLLMHFEKGSIILWIIKVKTSHLATWVGDVGWG